MPDQIEQLGENAIVILLLSFCGILFMLGALVFFSWWWPRRPGALSPYTRRPLKFGTDVASSVRIYVQEFILSHSQPENPFFDFALCSICPVTGRIFPDTVTKRGRVHVDWTFLQKRYPGRYVSWGSLSELQRATLRLCHPSMLGFQMEHSCPRPLPSDIDAFHAVMRPGPLYVDLNTKILLGWKEVPGTNFEVLIVQKPEYHSVEETL